MSSTPTRGYFGNSTEDLLDSLPIEGLKKVAPAKKIDTAELHKVAQESGFTGSSAKVAAGPKKPVRRARVQRLEKLQVRCTAETLASFQSVAANFDSSESALAAMISAYRKEN